MNTQPHMFSFRSSTEMTLDILVSSCSFVQVTQNNYNDLPFPLVLLGDCFQQIKTITEVFIPYVYVYLNVTSV